MGIRYISGILVIAWMLVMFNLSADNKETSAYKSKQVTAVIQQMVSKLPQHEKLVSSTGYITEHAVRKTGHVLEYFLLTMLVIIASTVSSKGMKQIFWNALFIPILFAISDELHQLYIPGRGPQAMDVLIDGLGVALAVLFASAFLLIKKIYNCYKKAHARFWRTM